MAVVELALIPLIYQRQVQVKHFIFAEKPVHRLSSSL